MNLEIRYDKIINKRLDSFNDVVSISNDEASNKVNITINEFTQAEIIKTKEQGYLIDTDKFKIEFVYNEEHVELIREDETTLSLKFDVKVDYADLNVSYSPSTRKFVIDITVSLLDVIAVEEFADNLLERNKRSKNVSPLYIPQPIVREQEEVIEGEETTGAIMLDNSEIKDTFIPNSFYQIECSDEIIRNSRFKIQDFLSNVKEIDSFEFRLAVYSELTLLFPKLPLDALAGVLNLYLETHDELQNSNFVLTLKLNGIDHSLDISRESILDYNNVQLNFAYIVGAITLYIQKEVEECQF